MQTTITNIAEGSIAHDIGLEKGDVVLSINGHDVKDVIDYMFYARDNTVNLRISRAGKIHTFKVKKKDSDSLGIEMKPFKTKSCRNKCIFCFVDQMPRGMRKTLYLKDDDYRMSFLYGNYITLTNLTDADKKRIMDQRLSPLYVSVHTTNNELRRKILGNTRAPDILKELLELTSAKIKIHAQIVLCPGLNDGEELSRTLKDLLKFYPYVASIAVVPVGLTKYKKSQLRPFEKSEAVNIIEIVKQSRDRFKKRHGDPVVYVADEFYIRAELPFPPLKDYGDLPQIENGVGLVPSFLHAARKLKIPKKIEPRKVAVFTGASFMPYLEDLAKKLNTIEGLDLEVIKVENKFFGPMVTVAGLLTGKDIVKAIGGKTGADCLLVPNITLKHGSDVFLDNVTLKDVEECLGMRVKAIEPTPEGLLKGITDGCKWEN
jgi:putative radical SAM enzyme (TIGR03279 family)